MKTTLLLMLLLFAPTRAALLPNVSCVCVGSEYSCVVSGVGDVVCWGSGADGRLGYSSTTNYYSPSAALAANPSGVRTTQTGLVAVLTLACGYLHTIALLADGSARGWGRNSDGQLGRGHTRNVGDNEHPWEAPDGGPVTLSGPVLGLSCGEGHCCSVMAAPNLGRVACWGDAAWGQLGYSNQNDIGDNEIVASAGFVDVGGSGNVSANFCGIRFSLVLMSDGALRGWGDNTFGQLGLGHTNDIGDDEHPSSQPHIALGLGSAIAWISAGLSHSCVVSDAGEGKCWGHGGNGRLGTGNTSNVHDPSTIGFIDFGVGAFVVQLESSSAHNCGVLATGDVKCFGESSYSRLGCGWACPDRLAPNETVALNGVVSGLALGSYGSHTLAVHPDGQFLAWGWNSVGQLGYGDTNDIGDDETPASVGDVNFSDGVSCATPLPNYTAMAASVTATTASRTATATATQPSATQPSATRASHTQTGITRMPRSRPATRGSSSAPHATMTTHAQQPLPSLASSPSPSAGSSVVLVVVLVGVVVALLVLTCLVGLTGFLVVRLRRVRSRDDERSGVAMESHVVGNPVEYVDLVLDDSAAQPPPHEAPKKKAAAKSQYTWMPAVSSQASEYAQLPDKHKQALSRRAT